MFSHIIALLFISATIASPTPNCFNAVPRCEDVECGSNQQCVILGANGKLCSRTSCQANVVVEATRPVEEVERFGAPIGTLVKLNKRLECPEHFAPLCMFHECGHAEECIETEVTASTCPKAKCVQKL
jgi:hypothetical protein